MPRFVRGIFLWAGPFDPPEHEAAGDEEQGAVYRQCVARVTEERDAEVGGEQELGVEEGRQQRCGCANEREAADRVLRGEETEANHGERPAIPLPGTGSLRRESTQRIDWR